MQEEIVHLMTPGIDSVLSYLYMRYELNIDETIRCFYASVSKLYSAIETKKLKLIAEKIFKDTNDSIQIRYEMCVSPWIVEYCLENENDAFYINRNLLLMSLANGIYPNAKAISMGITKYDRVYDTSEEYLTATSKVLFNNPKITSYIRHLSKENLGKWFIETDKIDHIFPDKESKIDFLSNKTYSCYSGDDEECLSCKACFRKNIVLFKATGIVRNFQNKELLSKYVKDDTIPKPRKEDILQYLKQKGFGNKIFSGI